MSVWTIGQSPPDNHPPDNHLLDNHPLDNHPLSINSQKIIISLYLEEHNPHIFVCMGYVLPNIARFENGFYKCSNHPEGRGFDSRYSRHVGTLSKSFAYSCRYRT